MTISATDFQLRVNEYFMKLVQGEQVVIERYGKKFAVLVSANEYEELQKLKESIRLQGQTQVTTNNKAESMTIRPKEMQDNIQAEESSQNQADKQFNYQSANLGEVMVADDKSLAAGSGSQQDLNKLALPFSTNQLVKLLKLTLKEIE